MVAELRINRLTGAMNKAGRAFAGRFGPEFRDDAESTVPEVLARGLAQVDITGERVGQIVINLISLSNRVAESRKGLAFGRGA